MKILLLGHTGMLGHMVKKYLTYKNIEVITNSERWPNLKNTISDFNGNCQSG